MYMLLFSVIGGIMDFLRNLMERIKKLDKRNVMLIVLCMIVLAVVVWYGMYGKEESDPNNNLINKGQVARSVSLLFHSDEEIDENSADRFVSDENKWYEKYMNMMYKDTYFAEKEIPPTEKEAMSSFTYGDLDRLYTNIGVVDEELLSYVKNNKSGMPIKLEDWNEIFGIMVEKLDVNKKVEKINIVISGTISRDASLPQWTAATTYGNLKFDGMSVDYYIDKGITVLVKDGNILSIVEVYSDDVTYHNSFIVSMSGGNIRAYIEGCIREFISNDKTSSYNNVVADIVLEDGKLQEIKIKSDTVAGKVLASSPEGIEIESYGTYGLDENCRVYKVYGAMQMSSISEVLVGYDTQKFVLNEDGQICAVIIDRDVQATNIRVLIKTTGFEDIYHDYVTVSSTGGCIVSYGNGSAVFEIEPGTEYTFSPESDIVNQGRIKISSKGVDGKICINSLTRGYGVPNYRGTLEIILRGGKLVAINELPLEEYLYSVVPSEMPWNYNYEALKAQAICARSFAYIHLMSNRYSEFGAHVDDSTTYQVYNNSEEQTVSNAAVDETYGQVLVCGNNVISAYFFSTSCGTTTTSGVWGSEAPYTQGKILSEEAANMNLMDEAVFDAFIRTNYSTYDSEYPWYRWRVTQSLNRLTERVNEKIGTIKAENIQVLGDEGQWINKEVTSVGQVKKIETGERGPGGVLKYVTIFGTECTVKVYKEYNIRVLFSPEGVAVSRGTGDEVTTMSMLPSGFFVLEEQTQDNLLSAYTFIGGGYGHGVGMSQNGANTMAKLGKTCEEILTFFYKDVSIEKKY